MSEVLIKWVNTFPIDRKVSSLTDLSDGVVLFKLLYSMDPSFGKGSGASIANINVLKGKLVHFLKQNHATTDRLVQINPEEVGKGHDLNGVKTLLECCLYVSVHCINKETMIQNILGMEELEQKLLMEIITSFGGIEGEGVDEDEIDVDDENQERGSLTQTNLQDETESLKRMETTSALVVQLQEKVHQLEKEKAEVQARYEKVRKEQKETEVENLRIQSEMEAALSSKKQEIDAAVAEALLKASTSKQTVALQSQRAAEKAGRQQEELEAEIHELKVQLESGKRKSASEIQELKTTIRKLQDELDLANSKLKKICSVNSKIANI